MSKSIVLLAGAALGAALVVGHPAAGATSAIFSVTTTTVTAATTVTIFASFGGATSVATLTVNP